MERAPLLVHRRLFRTTRALTALNIPHAVVGECATALWVASVDKTAMRNSRDVDIMIERVDFPRVQAALAGAGFVSRHLAGIEMFLESPDAKARNAVHIHFAGERIRPDAEPNPPSRHPPALMVSQSFQLLRS